MNQTIFIFCHESILSTGPNVLLIFHYISVFGYTFIDKQYLQNTYLSHSEGDVGASETGCGHLKNVSWGLPGAGPDQETNVENEHKYFFWIII